MRKVIQLGLLAGVLTMLPLSAEETSRPIAGEQEEERQESPSSLKPEQVKEIEGVIRKFLYKNPKIVAITLEKYMKIQKAEELKKIKGIINKNWPQLIDESTASVIGAPNGSQVIVAFLDINCGHCRRLEQTFSEVIKDNKNLKIIMRQLPILGENSLLASKALLAAQEQGRFKEFYQAIFNSEEEINIDKVIEIAQKINLNLEKFKTDLDSDKVKKILDTNEKFARMLQVGGTPTLIVGGQMVSYVDANELRKLLKEADKV
jgi:protein-disulfide isomerase